MFDTLRYQLLPYLKVRLLFTWWSIRYGGVKNIPSEKLAERMEYNITRTRESLYNALRVMPDDVTEEERQELLDTIREFDEVERIYRQGQRRDEE